MATKNFMTLENLQTYDALIKGVISTEDAKSIKSITVVGNTVNFFKNESASGQPSYTVDLPDVSGFMELISDAEGGKLAVTAADGSVSESEIDIDDVVTSNINAEGDEIDYLITSDHTTDENSVIKSNIAITDLITGYETIDSDASFGEIIIAYGNPGDTNKVNISAVNINDVITGYAISEHPDDFLAYFTHDNSNRLCIKDTEFSKDDLVTAEDNIESGYLIISSGNKAVESSQITESVLGNVVSATQGFDDDNTIADFIGEIPQGSSATSIVGYIDEVAGDLGDEVDAKSVYIVDNGSTSAYAKVYSIYQGTGSAQSPVVGEKLIDINIPKDQVVEDGSVVDITFHDSKLWDGNTDVTELIKGSGTPTAADAGKYIKLELQNVTDPLYIAAQSLVDTYTAASGATQVQLAISNANEISATLVAGGVGTTELAAGAVTTAKIDNGAVTGTKIANGAVDTAQIADDAVTAAKISIAAHSETQTASTDGLAISVTTTDGQVSAVSGSIAANTYDSYGSASAAQTAAEGYTDSAIAGLDATVSIEDSGNTNPLNITITQTDGELVSVTGSIDANTFDSYGSAATAESNANTYTDNATAAISTSAIEALFA